MDGSNEITSDDSFFETQFMPRPRIDSILDQAAKSKLVYVIAGAGYGKTQAVRHYIEQQPDAVVRWVHLTDSDNVGSRYWENLTYSITFDNPDLAVRLREFGFPETESRFKQFAGILRSVEHRAVKTFLVLDDFHVIHSKQALTFAERCAYLQIPGACVIIISRKEPEINAVSLFSKGQVSIITEDQLRFTDFEISDFLRKRAISFSAKNLPQIIDATKGWALAIQLFSLVLKRIPSNLDFALDTMKMNIFKLMETEAFNDFPENIKKLMVKLSLASNLTFSALEDIFHDNKVLQEAPQLASFIWYDSFTGAGRVHPLYWEFLQSKQDILSPDEKKEVYMKAASWCSGNDFCLDTMYYLAKAKEYKQMVELLFSYPFKLPHDTCEYFIDIIENLEPDGENAGDTSLLMLKNFFMPLLLVGTGRYEDAEKRALSVIREWEHKDTLFARQIIYASYSSLVYIDIYLCTVRHEYNSPKYIEKSMEYYKRASVPFTSGKGAFFVPDIRSMACPVGEGAAPEEFDVFLDATRRTAVFIAKTHHNMYYGFEDLALCELAFFKNQPDLAKGHAHEAILKAREKNQYSVESMAAHYLLRISLQEGDYPMVREVLRQLRAHLETADFWNRQLLYDLFTGFFYAQIGLPKLVPSWLVMDEKEVTSEVRIPARELVVAVKCHIASKKFNHALTVLSNSYPREPYERFLLSELVLSLLTAVARQQTGDTPGAVRDFGKAYSLSLGGLFEMPFVELGKNLRPLVAAVQEAGDGGVPEEWLKSIDRKASIYAKKTAAIMNTFKREQKIEDTVQLSDRETEVLSDLYHGLSRDEIAANRYLSVNTVKKILQSIYIKLDANNNVDAIRIALEKKLIE